VGPRALVPAVALAALALAGGATRGATPAPGRASPTVWLCFPGHANDPCASSLATTVVSASGARRVVRLEPAAHPRIDCFYVYPTVSFEDRGNADLQIQLPELLVAQVQAAQFSRVCRVFAPVYRQITDRGLTTPALHASPSRAYDSVLAAWRDYLAHDNDGRGVVLIGHSQGAYILKHLVATVIDRSAAERRLLVSAILLGGQVLAPDRPGARGSFRHVPPCDAVAQTGCVIAYSSFAARPPAHAEFGRDASRTTHVMCVNPGALGGGTAPITPLFPAAFSELAGGSFGFTPATAWVSFPGLYTARCERSGTASWLEIDPTHVRGDDRPLVRPLFGAGEGLHGTDVNIALANLVAVVGAQARFFARSR
jgi:Protein of unknown function (DUF3089)